MTKRYLTVVIELPADPAKAKDVLAEIPLFENFHGGYVTAMYAGDAISENEVFEANADPMLIKTVRDQVAARA